MGRRYLLLCVMAILALLGGCGDDSDGDNDGRAPYPSDTSAPTVPEGLTAIAVSTSRIDLAWGESTDDVGVSGYELYRDNALVGASIYNSYSDRGLAAATEYCYAVLAYDASGNRSGQSSEACATTDFLTGTQTFGDAAWSMQQTSDGGYAISRGTQSLGASKATDVYLVKTDANGGVD